MTVLWSFVFYLNQTIQPVTWLLGSKGSWCSDLRCIRMSWKMLKRRWRDPTHKVADATRPENLHFLTSSQVRSVLLVQGHTWRIMALGSLGPCCSIVSVRERLHPCSPIAHVDDLKFLIIRRVWGLFSLKCNHPYMKASEYKWCRKSKDIRCLFFFQAKSQRPPRPSPPTPSPAPPAKTKTK